MSQGYPNPSDDPTSAFSPGTGEPVSLGKSDAGNQYGQPAPYGQQQQYGQDQYGQYGQPQYGQQYGQEQYGQYPPAYDPQYGGYAQPAYGYPAPVPPTNTMAILSLVFAFVFAPLGVVFGFMARSQIKRTGESGDGLAMAGLIISGIFTVLIVLYIVFIIIFFVAAASSISSIPAR